MIHCSSCSASNDESGRFCSECGAALKPEYAATVTHGNIAAANDSSVQSSLSGSSHHGRFLPGTKVADRYRIVSLVGKGGMGEVYRADDLKLGHTVALKFLPKDLADDPQRLEYFHSEVRLTRQISHPNVCRVYDIGEVDGQHFLSMEYIDGEDLKILLRRIGRLPKDKGVEIAQQLCAGLSAAHDKGVLHRDLKPANIMIDGRGQVRITDFGLARVVEDGEQGEVAGTPAYMAPEQLTRGETTIQSDLYSLGLILYELFTGKAVHKLDSIPELMRAHEESSPPQPSSLVEGMDPTVERVILRCLEKKPDERPNSARTVAVALPGGDPLAAALAAGETPSPQMVANAATSGQMPVRVGLLWLGALVLGLLAAVFLASQASLLAKANPAKPAKLEVLAQQTLQQLGYDTTMYPANASAYGFEPIFPAQRMGESSMSFWYRQSAEPLVPNTRLSWIVTFDDPPDTSPAMLGVRLSADDARLLELRAVARIGEPARGPAATKTVMLQELFKLAKLDWKLRQEISPEEQWYPPIRADEWHAWGLKNREGVLARAALYRGKPVFFQVSTPDAVIPRPRSIVFDDKRLHTKPDAVRVAEWILQLIMLFAAIPLARRNLRLGRGDRQTAFRLAVLLFSLNMAAWFFEADHVISLYGEVTLLLSGLMWATFLSAVWWLGYLAVEPFVRRFWPNSLITWSRLFSGRYTDAQVGRDLLVGTTIGIYFAPCWIMLNMVLHRSFTGEEGWEWLVQRARSMLGPSHVTAEFLHCCSDAVLMGMFFLFLMFLLRLVFRRTVSSCVAFVLLWGAANCFWVVPGMGSDRPIALAFGAVTFGVLAAAWSFVLTRFGFLAFAATLFSTWLLDGFPITTHLSTWYGANSLIAMAAILAVGLYGFYASSVSARLSSGGPRREAH